MAWVVQGLGALVQWSRGFKSRSIQLSGGRTVHYLERHGASPPIVLIPGLTMEAEKFVEPLARHFDSGRRLLIFEVPGQGLARFPPAPPWPWLPLHEMDGLLAEFMVAMGVSPQAPADVVGYSMGGAVLGSLVRGPNAALVRRKVLLAPAFKECIDGEFKRRLEVAPEQVHAFESTEDMRRCFCETAFGVYPESMPGDAILDGLLHLRRGYGEGYYASVARFLMAQPDSAACYLPEFEAAARQSPHEFLYIIGDRDNCVDPDAVAASAARVGSRCELLADVGHVGGPKGSYLLKSSFLSAAARSVVAFLE